MKDTTENSDALLEQYTFAARHGERTRGRVVPGRRRSFWIPVVRERQRGSKMTSDTPSSHWREWCEARTELAMVWRSGTDAGRPGPISCRVGESIWDRDFPNLSRGSDTLELLTEIHFKRRIFRAITP